MGRCQLLLLRGWNRIARLAAEHPWRCALAMAPAVFICLACLFHPAYETNDDVVMSSIAAGKFFLLAPDEHLIFTHPGIGLLLKHLYLSAPQVPWYALYLLATQAAAHVVVLGLLFHYCPLRRALLWFAVWLGSVGIYFLTHLQFTTTAFLAGQSGVLLLWEAARRLCAHRNAAKSNSAIAELNPPTWPQTPSSILGLLIAGSAFILWCEMIRWYMFYLIAALPLPAITVWWVMQRPGWRITAKAAGFATVLILAGFSLKQWHLAYYQADPEWREFYEYNELRVQFNDISTVVYNDQTRESFEQAGWSKIDMQMIQSWCYDDETIYSRAKLQQILNSRTWTVERQSLHKIWLNLLPLLKEPGMVLCWFLLVSLSLLVPVDRRQFTFNTVVLLTSLSFLFILTMFQKTPPARVYMPIMVWAAVATGWNYLNRSLANSMAVSRLSPSQSRPLWFMRPFQGGWRYSTHIRTVCLTIVTLLVPLGMAKVIWQHHRYQTQQTLAQGKLLAAFKTLAPDPQRLYVLWPGLIPLEDMNPLNSLAEFEDFHMLWLGWTQQLPSHRAMKARYGITNLMRDWPEHPELVVICHKICTDFYREYAKTHYDHEIRAVPVDRMLMGNPLYQFQKADGQAIAEKPRSTQVD